SNTSSNIGGGLYLFSTTPGLLHNTIAGNSANQGGGVTVASCSPIFTGNVIADNEANLGGGIRLWYSRSPLTNNLIADNRATISGSGLWIGGSKPSLRHTTLARNTGGDGSGVLVTDAGSTHSIVILTNTILVSHTVGISATAGSTATLEGTLWGSDSWANGRDWGGDGYIVTGTVNIWGDPAFVNSDGDDYHIGSGSAARNAGVDAGVTTDIDGDFRPKEGGYDIGADEFGQQWDIYLPLVAKN
ncbi:MAG: right-handed parallel beta-helix repeat-containing protein, partial [Anaerolineae bacterium]|nr:right-handed parallel beta-helix repeat-containing protein [Anaerolineae bacterium]